MPIKSYPLPSQELIRFFLSYDPDTGHMTWLRPPCRNQPQYVGRRAGFYDERENKGIEIRVAGQRCRAHRLIWKLLYNEEPEEIDHKDGNALNNKISNLRAATRKTNAQNSRKTLRECLAFTKGCYKPRNRNYWVAQIKKDGVHHYLGSHKTEAEAHAAYVAKAKELFGDFANAGYRADTA